VQISVIKPKAWFNYFKLINKKINLKII
jgi:hypothetical protein